jgi:hypothetical protein
MLPAPLERAPPLQLSAASFSPNWGNPGRLVRLLLATDKLFSSRARAALGLLGQHRDEVTPTRQLDAKCARFPNHPVAPFRSSSLTISKKMGPWKNYDRLAL